MNKLTGFIKENRKEFESKGPSDQLWSKIEAELNRQEKKKKTWQWYSIAGVAASLVICLSVFIGIRTYQQTQPIVVADVSPLYGKKEVQFASMIAEKKDSLENYATKNPELYKQFISDLAQLDADYEKLKVQLQTSPNRNDIVKAMIKNLEIRSSILSQQLSIINEVNQYKKENTI